MPELVWGKLRAVLLACQEYMRCVALGGMNGLMRWSPSTLEAVTLYRCFSLTSTEAIMQEVTLIGIDLGKHSFHIHW